MKKTYSLWKVIFIFTLSSFVTGGLWGGMMILSGGIEGGVFLYIYDFLRGFFSIGLGAFMLYGAPAFMTGCLAALLIYKQLNKYLIGVLIILFAGMISVFFTILMFGYSPILSKDISLCESKEVFFFVLGSLAALGSLVYIYRQIAKE